MIPMSPENLRAAYRTATERARQPKPAKAPPPDPILPEPVTPEPARKSPPKGPTKVDNVFQGQSTQCPECGKEFVRRGRGWSIKIHCSAKCRNRAWVREHPRRAA